MECERWRFVSQDDISELGIAVINLCAAKGLPGAVDLDVEETLQQLSSWVAFVDSSTGRMWKLRSRPDFRDVSENQFRIMAMVTALQRDLGVAYSPACIVGEYDARDSRNSFIHGPLSGQGGTCASLPFLYTAIGRALAYPLFIVQAKEHLFVRWDGQGEQFNIETTARGFVSHDDSHYLQWPSPITPDELRLFPQLLRSMSPREELACCIMERSRVLFDNQRFTEAIEAADFAAELSSYYAGARLVTRMAYRIVLRLRGVPHARQWAALTNDALIVPSNPAEAWAIRNAKQHLIRQFKIRGDDLAPHDEALAPAN